MPSVPFGISLTFEHHQWLKKRKRTRFTWTPAWSLINLYAGCTIDATFVIFKLSVRQNAVMRYLIFILVMTAICISCKKDQAGEPVEIYLLKSYQTLAAKCQIDPSVSILEDKAVIKNQDIFEYSKTEYTFKLTDQAIEKVKTFVDKTHLP